MCGCGGGGGYWDFCFLEKNIRVVAAAEAESPIILKVLWIDKISNNFASVVLTRYKTTV